MVDFGIAKAALRSDDARSGLLKGKISYMSPEQCTGGPIDRRSDVFSLGIVLYELATTTRLFKGANDAVVIDAILKGRAPLPRVRRPDLPNELAMIIMRALDTDPARRYQTAEELRVALDRFAVAANLPTSDAAVAGVVKKMFGERPEPWLDLASDAPDPKASWTELPLTDTNASGATRPSDVALATGQVPVHARSDTLPPVIAAMQAAGAPQQPAAAPRRRLAPRKLALAAVPVLAAAVAALAIVATSGSGDGEAAIPAAAAVSAAPAAAARQVPTATPAEPAEPAAPVGRERTVAPATDDARASSVPTATPATGLASAASPAQGRRAASAGKQGTAPSVTRPAGPEGLAAPVTETPARVLGPEPAPPPEAAPAPPALPAPPPAPAIAAAPAKPAAPAVEAAIPTIPQALVNRIAWENSRELAKCEGQDSLKGEVTVRFIVGTDGRVTQPQIATKMKKPKLAACILRSLGRWKFPSQPATGAQGSYTVVFQ